MYLRIHVPCLACDFICFKGHLTCAQGKRFFFYQNECISVKQAGEQPKTPYKLDLKIPMKLLFDVLRTCTNNKQQQHLLLPSFLTLQSLKFSQNLFQPKWSLVRREKKGKSHLGSITFKPKNSVTLEATMFKVWETEGCELLKEHCGKFWFFLAR